MKSAVIIKGNKYGFQIVLQPDLPFEELVSETEKRFQASGAFFDSSKPVAVSFSGRDLEEKEVDILVDTMEKASNLVVSYVIEGAKAHETRFARALDGREGGKPDQDLSSAEPDRPSEAAGARPEGFGIISRFLSGDKVSAARQAGTEETNNTSRYQSEESEAKLSASDGTGPVFPEDEVGKHGQFYRGILRSGQKIEVDGSFVILGDVNPGAQIIAGGNVVVLGSLKGTVYAGYPDDSNAIVAALNMEPMQIQIGEYIARSADSDPRRNRKPGRRKKQTELEARMAYVDEGNICIEKIDRKLISEISSRSQ